MPEPFGSRPTVLAATIGFAVFGLIIAAILLVLGMVLGVNYLLNLFP